MGWSATALAFGLLVVAAVSLSLGRYSVGFGATVGVLVGHVPFVDTCFTAVDQTVLLDIRLPRILCGILVGTGLAAAGAGYQTMFRNPLVSPHILGVSGGAGFGAALGLLLHLPYLPGGADIAFTRQTGAMAFAGGLIAAALSLGVGRGIGQDSPIVLVISGIVVGSVFAALISVTEYPVRPASDRRGGGWVSRFACGRWGVTGRSDPGLRLWAGAAVGLGSVLSLWLRR